MKKKLSRKRALLVGRLASASCLLLLFVGNSIGIHLLETKSLGEGESFHLFFRLSFHPIFCPSFVGGILNSKTVYGILVSYNTSRRMKVNL